MVTVKTVTVCDIFSNPPVFVIMFGAGAVGVGAASRYNSGSGSTETMQLLAALAPALARNTKINIIEVT
jgi:hypothetical protein